MIARSWRRSLWDADPLSWFTMPNLPLVSAGLIIAHGVILLGPASQAGSRPQVQAAALGLTALAAVWVHVASRPRRGAFTVARALVAVVMAASALVISAVGYIGDSVSLALWWAPLSVALVVLALVPYSSAMRLAVVGSLLVAVGFVTVLVVIVPDETDWPPVSAVLISLSPIVTSVIGGVVMIRSITSSLAEWSERPLELASRGPSDTEIIAAVDRQTSARIADATEFITAVLRHGAVTEGDARRAAVIAARLRDHLRSDLDRTWIERVAEGRDVTVDDPDRLAEGLDLAQRTAMRALLDAVLGDANAEFGAARVELRRTENGGIAVALRIVSTLPEGRRETFLAPYYVSLRSAVENLRWSSGPVTAVEFEVANSSRSRTQVQRTREPGTPGGPITR